MAFIIENNAAGQRIQAEALAADRTTTDDDFQKLIIVSAVDLTLTLHTPSLSGFRLTVLVDTVSAVTGVTILGAINGGSTSAVNTAATDAQGDRSELAWTGTAWIGTFSGTWSVT